MRINPLFGLLALLLPPQERIELTQQQINSRDRFIAVSAVSPSVAWISGNNGSYARTTDGGKTWQVAKVPGAERLDFRDVHGFSATSALLLSAGSGAASKIYKTTDGGKTWKLTFTNADSSGFYDCMDFFDDARGLVIGDSYDGQMAMLATSDAGLHWRRVRLGALPQPMPGEGSFASSGTCILAQATGFAWAVTTRGRVLRSTDYGLSWTVSTAMPTASDSVGLTSVTFRDNLNGFVFGGYGARPGDTLVYETSDGGKTWAKRRRPPNGAGIWGGSFVTSELAHTIVTVGPKGAAYSRDGGDTWTRLDSLNYWGIGFAPGSNTGWAVGSRGLVVKLTGF